MIVAVERVTLMGNNAQVAPYVVESITVNVIDLVTARSPERQSENLTMQIDTISVSISIARTTTDGIEGVCPRLGVPA
jgi:hypothetical protein